MTFDASDWERLELLREHFLTERPPGAALADYWRDHRDLELYDRVFAARIGWKWDAACAELRDRAPDWSGDRILDYGCGTGIATRRYLDHFPDTGTREVLLFDRSPAAMEFAAGCLESTGEGAAPRPPLSLLRDPAAVRPDVLLVSHVLGELDARHEARLLALARTATRILWVEAGSRALSRRLSAIRDALLDDFRIIAPCTHQTGCSALRASDTDWCHFFARPPAAIFQDAEWTAIGRRLRIDLRALPYHFLALEQRSTSCPDPPSAQPSARILGRPHIERRLARVRVCDADGLHERSIDKRADNALFKILTKHPERVRCLAP